MFPGHTVGLALHSSKSKVGLELCSVSKTSLFREKLILLCRPRSHVLEGVPSCSRPRRPRCGAGTGYSARDVGLRESAPADGGHLYVFVSLFFFSSKDMLIDVRARGMQGDRVGREPSLHCPPPHLCLDQGSHLQPGHAPWPGIKPQLSGVWANAPPNQAARPRPLCFLT